MINFLIILALVSIVLFVSFSTLLSNQIINTINNFQNGLLSFFKYVNKESSSVEMLDDNSKDEFGNMARVVNQNISKSKNAIDSDNKFLEQINEVVEVVKTGNLSTKVNVSIQL